MHGGTAAHTLARANHTLARAKTDLVMKLEILVQQELVRQLLIRHPLHVPRLQSPRPDARDSRSGGGWRFDRRGRYAPAIAVRNLSEPISMQGKGHKRTSRTVMTICFCPRAGLCELATSDAAVGPSALP